MIRQAEAVLNGHPDKFCDLVADRLVRALYAVDPEAYAQIEVSVWSDLMFLTGGAVTRVKADLPVRDIVVALGREIGYTGGNHIDVSRYRILDHVCWITGDPTQWTHFSNDQCIVTGYAGYDHKTHFLPPEQFLCWRFREVLVRSISDGLLFGQGPDGKLLLTIREEADGWRLDTLLVTLQQEASLSFVELVSRTEQVLREAWAALRRDDARWVGDWGSVRVLVNPNGPLLNGGSDGDNGQTGRKLVMDHYGPRIPLGGGALYGKDLSHIDRLGAFHARRYAVEMVRAGAREALVRVCFAPGMDEPLSVDIVSDRRPHAPAQEFFRFDNMRRNIRTSDLSYDLALLGGFYNMGLSMHEEGRSSAVSSYPDLHAA
jgi:S-adenosylmethionine synthetase